jgi:hypothetical protein
MFSRPLFSHPFVRKRVISLATTTLVATASLAFARNPMSSHHVPGAMPVQYVNERPDYYDESPFSPENDLRREVQALAEQSDRFVRNGSGGSCRPPAGDDYLNDHKPIGSIPCVVGEAGVYQEVIPVDLEKAVKAVGSVIAGGH